MGRDGDCIPDGICKYRSLDNLGEKTKLTLLSININIFENNAPY